MDNEDTIMKLFKRLPKGGAGLARLQVRSDSCCVVLCRVHNWLQSACCKRAPTAIIVATNCT